MPAAGRRTFAGVFLISLSTLLYQLLLTRVFSVTMYYHFAFVAISLTMFGMSVGALLVYLLPRVFRSDRLGSHLSGASLAFAIAIAASLIAHLMTPFTADFSLAGIASIVFTYAVLAVPFTCSGIVIALSLTRFPRQVGALYAADLGGAAMGCLLLAPLMKIAGAPTAVIATAAFAAAGAVLFAADWSLARLRRWSAAALSVLAVFTVAHAVAARHDSPLLRPIWVKGRYEPPPLVERWNPFSRIRVVGDPHVWREPSGWGLSGAMPEHLRARELHLDIDSYAGTELTAYNGDPRTVEHLKYDVTNVVHYLRPHSRVLVVGTGGGRDVLSALAFGQKSVTGVEINPDILELVNGRFGEFTGHLDRDPRVRFVNDEARSFIARMPDDRVDIVQISLIDTWAATASGAFVLTESSLYTLEAWRTFLDRLAPHGILSVSRWYYADRPGEVYRTAALAAGALMDRGVQDPGDHFAIIRARPPRGVDIPDGIGTLLVSPDPLSARDVDTLEAVAERMQFDIIQSPRVSIDDTFAAIASGGEPFRRAVETYPLDISPPTDDSPFFFHMLRFGDVFNLDRWRDQGIVAFNMKAVGVLGVLLVTVVALTLACIVLPLCLSSRPGDLAGAGPHLVYFLAIGLGFMLIEISQLQRLTIFLGHPAYSLSVVLFSLLVSSGLGSLSTARVSEKLAQATRRRLLLAVVVLAVFGLATPVAVSALQGASTAVRIAVSVAMLAPLGFFMGMAFPLGMRVALASRPHIAPWLWGVNGAASVCASVLAMAIAIGAGIPTAFWAGVACYAVGCLIPDR